jgi:arylsulfatase A-like enzyme
MSIQGLVRSALGAILAGALGGALVGWAESVLVTTTSAGAEEYWLFLFGIVAYGALGAAFGLGVGVAWQLLRRGRASELESAQIAAAVAVFLPAFAVGRYHVSQRIFREGLVLLSPVGLLTHVLLVVAALLTALLGVLLVRTAYRVAGMAGPVAAFALSLIIGFLIGVTTRAGGESYDNRPKPAARVADKPNVIVVVADTLRADDAMASPKMVGEKSGIGRLVRDGVTFEQAYAQASWTRPSIASILTSQYPSAHGAVHKMDFLPDRVLTLAEALRAEGYFTTAFTTNINVAPVFNFQQGFDEFSYLEPSFYFWATDSSTKLAIYKGLRVARERFFSQRIYYEHYYQDAAVLDREVESWLASKPPEPFFLFVHYMDPHDPYFEMPYNGKGVARVMTPSPPPDQAKPLHDLYREGVHYMDGYLHTMLGRLEAAGLYDRSIIAFTADHGEEFQEHGGWWHGTSLYAEQLHVPLIIKRAKEPAGGTTRADVARTIDISSSMMAAAGLPVPASFMGIDLFTDRVAEPLLAEEDLEGNQLVSIQSDGWKLISANPGNPRGLATTELFNLREDPAEKNNLAATEKHRVSDMFAQLESLRARIAEHGARAVAKVTTDVADPGT